MKTRKTRKAEKPRFHIHTTCVAKEHFLDDELQRLAEETYRKALAKRCPDGYCFLDALQAPSTGKAFGVGCEKRGNDVHFFINDDRNMQTLMDDVRRVLPIQQ